MISSATGTSLTTGERRDLKNLEDVIEGGRKAFVAVGRALLAIRDKRLYTDVADTFELYCSRRWGFSRQRAQQLIDASKVIDTTSTIVDVQPPDNEAQARELAKLDTPEKQADAWVKAVNTAPKDSAGEPRITAKHVAEVVKQSQPNGKSKPETTKESEPVADKEVAEPQEPEPQKDALGCDIPKHLAGVASDSFYADTVKLLNKLIKDVKSKGVGPVGAYLLLDETVEGLTQARNMMVNARFYAVCPKCEGTKRGCGECRKSGYVTKWRADEMESFV